MKFYTKEELAINNGMDGTPTWIAYNGKIYDVSTSPLFKNGKHYKLYCGIDLTGQMEDAPHLEDILQKFAIIGELQ